MVERFIPGNEHRLLVVGGQVVAAARGESLWVTGDGSASVSELIDSQINTDPRRGDTEEHPLGTVNVAGRRDPARPEAPGPDAGLGAAGRPESADPAQRQRRGRRHRPDPPGRGARGGAGRAHRRPRHRRHRPGLRRHLQAARRSSAAPSSKSMPARACWPTSSRPAARRALSAKRSSSTCSPEGESGRIPVVGVTGTLGTSLIARWSAACSTPPASMSGVASGEGLYLDRRQVAQGRLHRL